MRAWWLSWYAHPDDGGFTLHTPWWTSGYTMDEPPRDIIVAAVQAEDEEAAWEVVHAAYDIPPTHLERRFCDELEDRETQPSARQPWSTSENGRFVKASWMQWPTDDVS